MNWVNPVRTLFPSGHYGFRTLRSGFGAADTIRSDLPRLVFCVCIVDGSLPGFRRMDWLLEQRLQKDMNGYSFFVLVELKNRMKIQYMNELSFYGLLIGQEHVQC